MIKSPHRRRRATRPGAACASLLAEDPEVEVVGECADGDAAARGDREPSAGPRLPRRADAGHRRVRRRRQALGGDRCPRSSSSPHTTSTRCGPSRLRARLPAEAVRRDAFRPDARASEGAGRARSAAGHRAGVLALAREQARAAHLERMVIRSGGRVRLARAEEIDWIEAEGNYVRVARRRGVGALRETLAELEAQLDPRRFLAHPPLDDREPRPHPRAPPALPPRIPRRPEATARADAQPELPRPSSLLLGVGSRETREIDERGGKTPGVCRPFRLFRVFRVNPLRPSAARRRCADRRSPRPRQPPAGRRRPRLRPAPRGRLLHHSSAAASCSALPERR